MSLLVLHGFTQNGARLRGDLAELTARLSAPESVLFPDAPHDCSEASVARLYAAWGVPRQAPPYRCWWDASDDGRVYRGWEESRAAIARLLDAHGPAGILGFSQGAMAAAAIAALASNGELAGVKFVILVAGRTPRADVLQPLFEAPIRVPSLHVWGERDSLAAGAALAERFDPASRETLVWPGPHTVPVRGPAADGIVAFARRHGA
jgi:pimeloyl-ACP methyl ester carboxylesterase